MTGYSPDKYVTARIAERRDISDTLWTMRVDPGMDFHFTAGQYATLGVQASDKVIERAYSIASAPHERQVEFVIELVPHGELTPRLFRLGAGDSVLMRRVAKGRFTLDTRSGRTRHLLLCTVTGIAPFVSYVRTLHRQSQDGHFTGDHGLFVIQGASHSSELVYGAELAALAADAPWLTYVPTISRPWDDPAWTGETGRVDDLIRKYTDQWALGAGDTTAYLCGHPDMISNGKAILARRRWTKDALREEAYFVV